MRPQGREHLQYRRFPARYSARQSNFQHGNSFSPVTASRKRPLSLPTPKSRFACVSWFTMASLKALATSAKSPRLFDPHGLPRLESLAGLQLATFWQRAAAFCIDFLVVLLIFVPIEFAHKYIELEAAHHPLNIAIKYDPREFEDLLYFVLYSALVVWRTNGLTIGKRFLHIRVVSLTRPKITLWQAFERGLGYGASLLEGGFGFIQFFIHPNRQCVHDRIAETIVIQDHPPVRPV
jgi:uncharacterized RDD family membrane protein YckC